ncbi:MAG: hypothetical protein FWE90_08815 [Defluviitaleaceae bacterium]|nr:hypothetical protein [Defluviitaleaceae bacterium]
MDSQHDPIIIKPIDEVAKYLKNLIPANIPEAYTVKPVFKSMASEENIRNGVIAFRDFLYLFCDRLITDGDEYAKPPKKPSGMADYPFLHNITNLLVETGYHGTLSENGDSLSLTEIPSCKASVDADGKKRSPKISASAKNECLRFLTLCGFVFTESEVFYPSNPILLTGLKALSVADMELRPGRRYWNDNNLLRCDYRLIKAENSDMLDVLKDFLHPLPEEIQKFALKLHQRYSDHGLTCLNTRLGQNSFAYVYTGKSKKPLAERDAYAKRVWEFSYSLRHGYCLFVRAKKSAQYADTIDTFPLFLQEKSERGTAVTGNWDVNAVKVTVRGFVCLWMKEYWILPKRLLYGLIMKCE